MESILIHGMTFLATAAEAAGEAGAEAAGHGGESAAVGVSLLIPKLSELIPMLVAFSVILFVMIKYVWPPITDMLDKRAMTIRESLEKAEEARIEAERLLESYKEQMAEARKESAAILTQARQAAEATRADITAKAQAEAEDMVSKARQAIEGEKQAAIAELQSSVADLSVAVAGKLIGEELDADEHARIIEKYLAEAGSLNAN